MTRTVDDLAGGVFEIEATPPIPATACRICRATVTDRTICRACVYGPEEDTEAETEVFETI